MNLLQHEPSPYLRQHAENPVHWRPWGDEAFLIAQRENKPVLVSIGYSACHWCHVMEHESFSDPDVAAFMNTHFVNIKVDREERPDVDHFYMEAVQIIAGSGGWPLNCFLTPDRKPFFGGTYFPPVNRYGRPSWRQILEKVKTIYHQNPSWIADQSHRLLSAIGDQSAFLTTINDTESQQPQELMEQAVLRVLHQFDGEFGGLGQAPKFPQCGVWQFLLSYYHFTGYQAALDAVEKTMLQMYRGGIYDHIGGGFARYATDRAWKIPHFEKMLYDNAQLVMILANLYKITGKPIYRQIGGETLAGIDRDFGSPDGGFYSAYDADSEGEEGLYYVWTVQEVQDILGLEAEWFVSLYELKPEGNWEGKNIIYLSPQTLLNDEGIVWPAGITKEKWSAAKKRLLKARMERTAPGLDDKQLLGWNALQAQAHLLAYQAWGEERDLHQAQRTLVFIAENYYDFSSRRLHHLPTDYGQRIPAFMDDYAIYIQALLEAYQTSFELHYLQSAQALTQVVIEDFYDATAKQFYFQSKEQSTLPLRIQMVTDQSTPSGLAVMANNFIRLFYLTGQAEFKEHGERILQAILSGLQKYPAAFGYYGVVWLNELYGWKEVAMVGQGYQDQKAELLGHFLPELVLMGHETPAPHYPMLDKPLINELNIYFCQNFSCQKPVSDVKELMALF